MIVKTVDCRTVVEKDKWWEKVFKPDSRFDADTLTVLGVILPAMAVYTKKNFSDYLPGGKYANIQREEVKGVPKHNKLCERVFGMWDYTKRHSPNKIELALRQNCASPLTTQPNG